MNRYTILSLAVALAMSCEASDPANPCPLGYAPGLTTKAGPVCERTLTPEAVPDGWTRAEWVVYPAAWRSCYVACESGPDWTIQGCLDTKCNPILSGEE